ncbi:MAG: 4-phosphoerythronate dehydrogenase [Proteiniphilum sp.]|nr:4-phosphoerythronate dehydrogenase [Proteiniphilum sp.]
MRRPKILADAHIPYLRGVAEQIGEVEYLPGNQFTREAIRNRDALIVRTVTPFGEELLSGSNVQLICSATIGYDHIDTAWCDAHGIAWRTAPGCNAASVEQYITASLLLLADQHRFDLPGMTIGIVGVGNVGSKVAAACQKLGMRVLLNDPPREEREGTGHFTDLETIKREADFITFHTPLTRSGKYPTFHLAGDRFYDNLPNKPFIINAARGGVTCNRSLTEALLRGKVQGAVIDCWENEPVIDHELLQLTDIATPHIAGYSADGKWTASKMSIENLIRFFDLDLMPQYAEIPTPKQPSIELGDLPAAAQLSHAVWHTYHPKDDASALKKSPDAFYRFRSEYPLRREYHAFTVHHADNRLSETFRQLGFRVQ